MALNSTHVTCPFCSLHCDDLTVTASDEGKLQITEHGCEKARAGFERPPADATPRVKGKPVELRVALQEATRILKQAKRPLFAGLATDVDCMRQVMALADATGAIVDHMHTDAMMRNVRNLQTSGWITTTMAEVRNRADFVLFIGTSVIADFPRFYERLLFVDETLFGLQAKDRQCVYLGRGFDVPKFPAGFPKPQYLACPQDKLFDALAALRAVLNGKALQAATAGGVKLAALTQLAAQMKAAKYGVIVWDGGKFDFPGGDLLVQLAVELVRDLNAHTRFAGFPLVGNNGGASAQSVCAWQSGYPLRVSFATGQPEYDPLRYSTANVLAEQEADAMLWISTVTAGRVPPATKLPSIVLMEPGATLASTPDVYIPVGSPGVDHGGRLVRCDNVISLPLRPPHESPLPTVGQVVDTIHEAL